MSLDLKDQLGRLFPKARTAARAGAYQLVLGAGASVGAVNRYGALPLGSGLVKILQQRYPNAPILESDSLSRAYQRALIVSDTTSVWHALREIFTHAHHEQWFHDLAGLPWRRVWTLNIDDAFENAYEKTARSRVLGYRTISWDDPYSESGSLELIHLHGHVLEREPRRLVFSFTEYQRAAQERPVWDQILGGVLATNPVIAFGARLLDDPDVENLFLNNTPIGAAPSIIVDPYISDGNAWELQRTGYVVLRCDGPTMVSAWQESFGLSETELSSLYETTATVDLPQIVRMQTNHIAPVPTSHDYYGGDEPLWADACAKKPALLGWMRNLISSIEEWVTEPTRETVLQLVYGDRLTGVSSGLLLIAREGRNFHADVVMFDKSTRLNVERFIDYCRGRGPVLLIVDGGADFGDDIDKLAKRASSEENVSLYILLADRPHNSLRIEGRLSGAYPKKVQSLRSRLDRGDARAIVLKLETFGRLRTIELEAPSARVAHFAGRDVFSAMMEVEYALGFRKRIDGELKQLHDRWKENLVLLLSLAAQSARAVGVMEASFAVGVKSDVLISALQQDGHLAALVELVDGRLLSRQRGQTVDAVVQLHGTEEALKTLLGIIKGLAPLATRQSLRERNRVSVLVGSLMTTHQLRQTFPKEDLNDFFESLRVTFGDWNGRYWEQRAIYAV